MISVQDLNKISDFTIRMLYSLLDDIHLQDLVKYNSPEIKVYLYKGIHLMQYISTNSGYTYNEVFMIYKRPGRGLRTAISSYEIGFTKNLQDYIHADVIQDLFSLSTVLSDSEVLELYVSKVVSNELSTCSKLLSSNVEVIGINFSLLYEYYKKYGEQ